jgi:hypothetical protein
MANPVSDVSEIEICRIVSRLDIHVTQCETQFVAPQLEEWSEHATLNGLDSGQSFDSTAIEHADDNCLDLIVRMMGRERVTGLELAALAVKCFVTSRSSRGL